LDWIGLGRKGGKGKGEDKTPASSARASQNLGSTVYNTAFSLYWRVNRGAIVEVSALHRTTYKNKIQLQTTNQNKK